MPELPEVEMVRLRLAPAVTGRRLVRVRILDGRLVAPEEPDAVAAELVGERVAAVGRRGKYLVFEFESGLFLLCHLRMTGSFLLAPGGVRGEDAHRRAVVSLDDGADVVYRDVRRFGTWRLLALDELEQHLGARVGAEPLSDAFTPAALGRALEGRRAPVKAALLDQRVVAGVGNIYADEALWRARVHPRRAAGALDRRELGALRRAVREALEAGIARQGATLRDYRMPDGRRGSMQHEFNVYGRAGEPCPRCGTPIAKTRVAGRGTWYCPSCQRETPTATGARTAARLPTGSIAGRRASSARSAKARFAPALAPSEGEEGPGAGSGRARRARPARQAP